MNKTTPKTAPAAGHAKRDITTIVGLLMVIAVGYVGYHLVIDKPAPPDEAASFHSEMSPGSMDEAMKMLDNLPQDFDSLVQMGNSFMDQGSFAVAAELYKRALTIKDVPDVRVDFGACLNAMGLPMRAIEEFQKARRDDPKHGIASFNLGVVYMSQQQPDSARLYFKQYLKLEPNGRAAEAAHQRLQELGE